MEEQSLEGQTQFSTGQGSFRNPGRSRDHLGSASAPFLLPRRWSSVAPSGMATQTLVLEGMRPSIVLGRRCSGRRILPPAGMRGDQVAGTGPDVVTAGRQVPEAPAMGIVRA